MSLLVQKFGGTSVGSLDRIREVARRVAAAKREGHDLVVVVSAMAGETDRLLRLAHELTPNPDRRELDALVSTGEQVSSALLAMALHALGLPARSFLGHQVRIDTDSAFGRARIRRIDAAALRSALDRGEIAVVAGFQGVDPDANITTLGRGGSDTSAVALAAALRADGCEIFTDVDGIYTADPRICPHARKLETISFDEMLELASLGARVLQIRSVEFAKRYRVPLHVRSSFDARPGTWVVEEEQSMEDVLVTGVSLDRNQAKITVRGVPDRPGLAAQLFGPVAEAGIVVDMIIQSGGAGGDADMSFTVPESDFRQALEIVRRVASQIGARDVTADTEVVKVSVVGLGMRSHAGVAARAFAALAREGINIEMISTSEIKISVVIAEKYGELAVRALHEELVERAHPGEAVQ